MYELSMGDIVLNIIILVFVFIDLIFGNEFNMYIIEFRAG